MVYRFRTAKYIGKLRFENNYKDIGMKLTNMNHPLAQVKTLKKQYGFQLYNR